jgi:hypothetical protein
MLLGDMRFVRWALLVACASACAPSEPKVGHVRLMEADGVIEPPPGPTVEVPPGTLPDTLGGTVRVAIDRDVSFAQAVAVLSAIEAQGASAVPLVIYRNRIAAMPPLAFAARGGADTIRLEPRPDGRACVSPPETEEAACVVGQFSQHVDRTGVRQIVKLAVKQYGLHKVNVVVRDPSMSWAEVVRTVDGARTCCGEGQEPEITVAR